MERAVNEPSGRGALEKALALLTALAAPGGPHRLADLAHAAELAKPTAHRMLRTLVESGFARTSGGTYHVGPHLLGMAAAAHASSREGRFVRPVLEDLQRQAGHTVHYAARSGDAAVYLDTVEPRQAYRMASRVGTEVPLYCSAVGRAILAGLPASEVAAILDAGPLSARTPYTATDPDEIRAALAQVDERGYLVEDEQNEVDVRSVAAPVIDGVGAVVGAICVSGLTFVLNRESAHMIGPLVRDAAAALSAAFGSGTVRAVEDDEHVR